MEVRILGPLEVSDGGHPLALGGRKQRAVLAFLVLHANQVVSSDRLIDQLWGEEPPETVKAALHVYVSQLRKVLGAEVIRTRAPGYVLELEPEALDLHRFERLLEGARAAAAVDNHQSARDLLREALGLWSGPPLADFAYDAFAQAPILRLEELRLTALEDRVEADLALGRHAELVGELEALVAEHPLRERLRRQLILALYRSGRQPEALAAYREARQALIEELGIEPTQGLQDLERAVLRQDPALAPRSAAARDRKMQATAAQAPARAVLVVAQDEQGLDALLALAEPLARRPPRELILALLVAPDGDLASATARLTDRSADLDSRKVAARVAAFTSNEPGLDAARLAGDQSVDLLLVAVPQELVAREGLAKDLEDLLVGAPCDVAALVMASAAQRAPGAEAPVLVPFGGAEHEWAAGEVAAWIARSLGAPLRLLGTTADPERGIRDASRLLATASLGIQQVSGIVAEPVIVSPGPEGIVGATPDAGLVVLGLSDRWQREGLGAGRLAVVRAAQAPVLLVRGGIRPGGLAPSESTTRYTWSLERAT
jgi:DNA-binding SARP family transcriptional activator